MYMQWIGAALLAAGATAHAAEPPLTLDDAVSLAARNSPGLQSNQAAVDAAENLTKAAGRLPDPEAVAGIDNLPTEGIDAWSTQRDFMTMRKIGIMQSIPNRSKRRAEREAAQATVDVARSQVQLTEQELKQSVAQAWITAHLADRTLQLLTNLRAQLLLQVELARQAVSAGRATAMDAIGSQAQLAMADDRILQAQQQRSEATAELARWIGDAAQRALATPPSFRELPNDPPALLSSIHHHASLRAYDARISAAQSEIAVASAARRPDWSAELDYAQRGRGFSNMVSFQVRATLPLFAANRQDPAIAARRSAVRQLEAEREAELRMHTAEISQRLAEWQNTRARLDLLERERLPLARQRSALALEALRADQVPVRDTVSILAEQLEIERAEIELLATLGSSWAYLRYLPTTGEQP